MTIVSPLVDELRNETTNSLQFNTLNLLKGTSLESRVNKKAPFGAPGYTPLVMLSPD